VLHGVTTGRGRLVGALAVLLVVIIGVVWLALRPTGPGGHALPPRKPGASAVPSSSHPPGAGAGWRRIFDARFTGSRLDTSVWGTCYPWADAAAGCTNFGNTEYEWYLPSQAQVSGGALRLVAQRIPTQGQTRAGGPQEYACRSGMVTTYPSLRFEYGYLQAVARIPRGAGLWSALWLAPTNLRSPPEIDILESWGPPANRTAMYFHPSSGPRVSAHPATADLSSGWHTFGLSWTPSQLAWFVDGREVLLADQNVPHQPMYFIADLAESTRPDSPGECSDALLIRSLTVWQR
jgi:beta-glucanase (GH16 family)